MVLLAACRANDLARGRLAASCECCRGSAASLCLSLRGRVEAEARANAKGKTLLSAVAALRWQSREVVRKRGRRVAGRTRARGLRRAEGVWPDLA